MWALARRALEIANGKVSKSGDTMTGGLTIGGDLVMRGAAATPHDAIYWYPPDMVSSGALTTSASTDNGLARIPFADAATNRLKFVWNPPIQWLGRSFTYRVGWVREDANSGANVRWELAHQLSYLGGNFTATPTVVQTTTRAVPGATLAGWDYFDAGVFTPTLGPFGEMPFIVTVVRRLGADGADSYTGVASIFTVTVTATAIP